MSEQPDNKLSGSTVIPLKVEVGRVGDGRWRAVLRYRVGRQRFRVEAEADTPIEAIDAAHAKAGA